MSDQDEKLLSLIDACVKGEEKAWNLFVSQYGKVVRACLSAYFRGRAEKIDEVTQHVFIKLWKAGLKDFRGTNRYQFLSYLKLITINEAKTYLRSTVGQNREVSIDQDPASGDDARSKIEIASGAPNPEEKTMAREQIEILANHLKTLPLEHQQIFLMKAKGYKDREIGELLGIPDGTVASSYSRIIERLKRILNPG
ncbi:MAG: RNA polymerase sigma factor [Candidatus Binatia bacterium]